MRHGQKSLAHPVMELSFFPFHAIRWPTLTHPLGELLGLSVKEQGEIRRVALQGNGV